jgi:hypothetical protein
MINIILALSVGPQAVSSLQVCDKNTICVSRLFRTCYMPRRSGSTETLHSECINERSCPLDLNMLPKKYFRVRPREIPPPLLTSALDGGVWSASRPGRFTPRGKNTRYPLDRRLSGPLSRSGRCGEEKNLLLLLGIEPRPLSP